MEESHRKGVANHPDPESCGVGRKGSAEALTGVCAGVVLSREINDPGAPTPLLDAEGNTRRDVNASSSWAQRGRRPSACTETPYAETGRSHGPPRIDGTVERTGKAVGRAPVMYARGKSDSPIVAGKPPNKNWGAPQFAEGVEPRGLTKGNLPWQNGFRTLSRVDLQSAPRRIRRAGCRVERCDANAVCAYPEQRLRVRPEVGARCASSARRDLLGGPARKGGSYRKPPSG